MTAGTLRDVERVEASPTHSNNSIISIPLPGRQKPRGADRRLGAVEVTKSENR